MEKLIIIEVSTQVFIKIILPSSPPEELTSCDDVTIQVVDNNNNYLVYAHDTILWALRCLLSSVEAALSGKLILPKFLKGKDIGYAWNEKIHYVSSPSEGNDKITEEWQDNYLIWNFKEFALWIYNKEDSIFLEVTPVYKWHFNDPNSNEAYISYDQFLASYKPCLSLEINKETVKKLLNKSEDLLKLLKENETRINKQ